MVAKPFSGNCIYIGGIVVLIKDIFSNLTDQIGVIFDKLHDSGLNPMRPSSNLGQRIFLT